MKKIIIVALLLLALQSKGQIVIDLSDTTKWIKMEQLKRDNINSRIFRQIQIYAYNDSVTIVDSPYLHGTVFSDDDDTFKYVVSTWLYYERNGKGVNSIGRGQSSNSYNDYMEYLNKEMLWEIWMDRGKRDYWLYDYKGRSRVSFKNNNIKRAFLTFGIK